MLGLLDWRISSSFAYLLLCSSLFIFFAGPMCECVCSHAMAPVEVREAEGTHFCPFPCGLRGLELGYRACLQVPLMHKLFLPTPLHLIGHGLSHYWSVFSFHHLLEKPVDCKFIYFTSSLCIKMPLLPHT